MPKISRFSNSRIFNFKRSHEYTFTMVWDNNSTFTGGSIAFSLNDLPSYTELTALFDKYRIAGVKLRFYPRINQQLLSSITSTTPSGIVPIVTVIDYDDDSVPANLDELMQYQNFKIHDQFKPFSVFLRPQMAIAAYSGAFTSYASGRKIWIDAASPGVKYYGLKIGTQNYSSGSIATYDPTWDIFLTYYIQCKYPR